MMFSVWEDVSALKLQITSSLIVTYLEALGIFCGVGSKKTLFMLGSKTIVVNIYFILSC